MDVLSPFVEVIIMNDTEKFDVAFEALQQKLSKMSPSDFFSECGISIEELPYKYQYSAEIDMNTVFLDSVSFCSMDLKCA